MARETKMYCQTPVACGVAGRCNCAPAPAPTPPDAVPRLVRPPDVSSLEWVATLAMTMEGAFGAYHDMLRALGPDETADKLRDTVAALKDMERELIGELVAAAMVLGAEQHHRQAVANGARRDISPSGEET